MMSPRHKSVRLVALGGAVFFVASYLAARVEGAATTHHRARRAAKHTASAPHSKAHRASTAKLHSSSSHRKAALRSTRGRRRYLPRSSRARLARLHLQPNRIEEIQQALIGAGYLNGQASGAWDESTRDAMRRFQSDNGFAATGLPDAKSLMKLGLGPHPLPAELQPTTAAAQVTGPPTTKAEPN